MTGLISEHIKEQDIFQKEALRRANALYTALFERRKSENESKSKLLKSHFHFKRTAQYSNRLEQVKASITFLTRHINAVKTMIDKNIIDLDTLTDIEHEYKNQI